MTIKTVLDDFVRAMQAGDSSALPALFTLDATWRVSPLVHKFTERPAATPHFPGVKKFTYLFKSWLFEPFNTIISESAKMAVIEVRVEGESKTEGESFYINEVVIILEFGEDGKICALREHIADPEAAAELVERMHKRQAAQDVDRGVSTTRV